LKKLYEENDIKSIATSIRAKTGKSDAMKVSEMSGEIDGIELGWTTDEIASHNIRGAIIVNKNVDGYAFYVHKKITSVKCLSGCKYIYNEGFRGCQGIQKVDLDAVISIGNNSFIWAYPLAQFVIRTSTVCKLGNTSALQDTAIAYGTGYIYVPSALIDSYKTATNWSVYADQFRALEDYTVDGTTTGELDESKI
jgi:hypothetical protein